MNSYASNSYVMYPNKPAKKVKKEKWLTAKNSYQKTLLRIIALDMVEMSSLFWATHMHQLNLMGLVDPTNMLSHISWCSMTDLATLFLVKSGRRFHFKWALNDASDDWMRMI